MILWTLYVTLTISMIFTTIKNIILMCRATRIYYMAMVLELETSDVREIDEGK